ncbi:Probable RNA-directed DNA polymerase from transposon BS [Eumeta japonica]|uniref:Probable RNA-directed DNA polymerase from transposon BS n=1 Tax=Eumeta variegata TaxID=151549 RepID=A0A4C1T2B7_EUMVA|nr:Probable RNA-directed DNA polymerase from transposon BS [Eumeta japonica]
MNAGTVDRSTARNTDRPGPNYSVFTDTTSRLRYTPADLRVVYWNAGGISGKTQYLRTLVQSQDIHIVFLGETKLRPRQELRLPNFFVYRRNEVSPRGITFRDTAVLPGRELRLFAAYRLSPPSRSRFCSSDILTIFDDCIPTIVTGDLNANHIAWGSRVISPAGRQLLQDSEQHGYEVIGSDTPSHIPTDPRFRADVLDVVLCHQLSYSIHVEVLHDMDTQHLPIPITLGTTAI